MATRLRGTSYKALVTRLPRNLVLIDGRCKWSQHRMQFVLERNFSYFGLTTFFNHNKEEEFRKAEVIQDMHAVYFASLNSSEGKDIQQLLRRTVMTSASREEEIAVMLVEKIPSDTALVMKRNRRVLSSDAQLFRQHTAKKDEALATAVGATASSELHQPVGTDLLVSYNFTAMCRIGMHLDRPLFRGISRTLYAAVPSAAGQWWFRRYVCGRRRWLWGTSEEDAVLVLGGMEGMRERRWCPPRGAGALKR